MDEKSVSGETREFFNASAETFARSYEVSPEFQERYAVWRRHIDQHIWRLADGSSCLDIGCGEGILSRYVATHGFRVTGYDQAERMIALARSRAQSEGLADRLQYLCCSWPLQPRTEEAPAGLILCSSVLEYVACLEPVIASFAAALKPRGTLLVSLPNRTSLYRLFERMFKGTFLFEGSYLRIQHHQFSVQQAIKLFVDHGLKYVNHEFFAVPRWLGPYVGSYRGSIVATMFLLTLEKK
jgi:2-polyprenyl-6-hydroxyphenyl methylase/3-demethylubiquinone-9 3-methyltransferase